MKKSDILLSQCMIVKNEEANIERALSWGKGIVDEQIVVDTGSMDRTVELAEKLGAKVFHFTWQDDFSAAKNFAIDQANGRWIALLDADEYMSREDAKKLRTYVEQLDGGPYGQIIARWLHLDDEGRIMASGTMVRVFVHASYLRYHRRIHEYLLSGDPARGKMVDAAKELTIFHTGYGEHESGKKKASKRNFRLIEKELEDHPDDCDMLGYLGDEYYSFGELDQAKNAFYRSIKQMDQQAKEYDVRAALTFTKLLEILVKENAPEEEMLEVSEKAKALMPKEADFDYQMGSYYINREAWGKAREHLEEALSILEAYGGTGRSMMIGGQLVQAYEMLAFCCLRMGDEKKCVYYAVSLLKETPYRMQTLRILLSIFQQKKLTDEEGEKTAEGVLQLLEKLYHVDTLKDRLFLLQAARQTGYQQLEKKIRQLFSSEELLQVDQAMATLKI